MASASFVWVNGHEVGYNEGAQEPAEYNITPYLKPGENTLAVCVLKYSDGYYLEGQDYCDWPESLTTYGCTPHLLSGYSTGK